MGFRLPGDSFHWFGKELSQSQKSAAPLFRITVQGRDTSNAIIDFVNKEDIDILILGNLPAMIV
jgi:hypothetical protein